MTATPVELVKREGGRIQRVGNLATTIAYAHHEVHEGNLYSVSYKSPDASPIADNGTIILTLTTGAKYCHVQAYGAMGGDAEGEFCEAVDITGGTQMAERNHNRPSSKTATAAVLRDPTVNDAGVLLEHLFMPGGTRQFAVGSTGSQRTEWICLPNTTYMMRLTNRSGGAQPGSIGVVWYEETNN